MTECIKEEFEIIQKYFGEIDEVVSKLLTEVLGYEKTFYFTSENKSESYDLLKPFYKVHKIL